MSEEKFVDILDYRIRFREVNKNSENVVVFLHGMAFNADTWEHLGTLDFLKSLGFRAIALDLPGFGKSSGKRLNRWNASDFLETFLETLGIKNFVLVGPSMGGGIALAYAIRYGKQRGLVLVAPAGLKDENILENLNKISCPILIFWGEKDKVFPVKMAYDLQNMLKNSRLVLCPNARHPCYLDSPKIFHRELGEFLREIFSK